MKRDWDDCVETIRNASCMRDHERTQHRPELASTIVLEALNRVGDRTSVLKDGGKIGGGLDEGRTGIAENRDTIRELVAPRAAGWRKES